MFPNYVVGDSEVSISYKISRYCLNISLLQVYQRLAPNFHELLRADRKIKKFQGRHILVVHSIKLQA